MGSSWPSDILGSSWPDETLWVSPVALKSGDEITFNGPQYDNPKDKQRIKELEEEVEELRKKLALSKYK